MRGWWAMVLIGCASPVVGDVCELDEDCGEALVCGAEATCALPEADDEAGRRSDTLKDMQKEAKDKM